MKLKIALIGHGKMGQMYEKIALQKELEIVERFIDVHPFRSDLETQKKLMDVSVLVDFSIPEAVLSNIQSACDLGINLVVGTTGWQAHLGEIKQKVEKSGIGMIYASNFSLGVNLFYKIVETAVRILSPFDQYDPFIEESHHKQKKDAPSGTALVLKQIVESNYPNLAVPVTSVRAGYNPGQHSVSFDSSVDAIRLEHLARNREGLAEGAVLATQWIAGKKGFFHFRDIVEQLIEKRG